MKYFTHNNYRLREIAEIAAQRSRSDKREALIAIVFSAMSIEAMVNEAELVAKFVAQAPGNEGALALAELLQEAEEMHASMWLKLAITVAAVSGKTIDSNKGVFGEVKLLLKIRDSLVHLKGELIDDQKVELLAKSHDVVKKLIGRNILNKNALEKGQSWLDTVANPVVADWACSLPPKFARDVVDQLSETLFGFLLQDGWLELENRQSLEALAAAFKSRFEQSKG